MDTELSKRKMKEQIGLLEDSGLLDAYGWSYTVEGWDVRVTMPSPSDGSRYTMVVNFEGFPQKPPSYKFENDWPPAPKIKANKGICIDGTRECYDEFGHPDRRADFDPSKHTLPFTLQRIYYLMR